MGSWADAAPSSALSCLVGGVIDVPAALDNVRDREGVLWAVPHRCRGAPLPCPLRVAYRGSDEAMPPVFRCC